MLFFKKKKIRVAMDMVSLNSNKTLTRLRDVVCASLAGLGE